MRIFKFHPATFERMYFVASSLDDARSKEDELWKRYFTDRMEGIYDEEDEIEERRAKFREGFAKVVEDDLCFIDSAY